MKRKKLNATDTPAQQFASLRQITSLTQKQCREVISLLQDRETTSRTTASAASLYKDVAPCLRDLQCEGKEGGHVTFPYMSFKELLQVKVTNCPLFSESLRASMVRRRNRLRLVIYADEVVAGNSLAAPLARKAMLIYITCMDFEILFLEEMWLTMSVMKTSDIRKTLYGFADIFQRLLSVYVEEMQDGIAIDFGTTVEMLWLETFLCLADHDAIRLMTGSKGAAGLKCCALCHNVLANGCGLVAENHCEISETDSSKWLRNTPAMMDEMASLLQACPNKSQLTKLETQLGWTWSVFQKSWLLDPDLKQKLPIDHVHYDAMHDYFSNGLICQQLGLWWSCVHHGAGVTLHALQTYASTGWKGVPHGHAMWRRPEAQFTEQLFKDEQDFRGDALACSLCLPLCVGFGEEVLRDTCPDLAEVLTALRALYSVVLCIQDCKRDWTQATRLRDLQKTHMKAWRRAHGRRSLRPKAHYSLHLPDQILTWKRLIDCFTCERKHTIQNPRYEPVGNQQNELFL